MSIEYLFSNPQYYPTIIRSTGLLSGEDRAQRINLLLGINVWLAARCKNTCVLKEELITSKIVLECKTSYENTHDPVAIIALLELGEISTVCSLTHLSERVALPLYEDPNQTVTHLFCKLGENTSFEPFWTIYHAIEKLGYPLDLEMYNLALARSPRRGDIGAILDSMKQSGIKADAQSYYYLILKSATYDDALVFFNLFLKENTDDSILMNNVVCEMINLAPSKVCVEQVFRHARISSSDISSVIRVESAFYARMIALAQNSTELFDNLEAAKQWLLVPPSNKEFFFGVLVPPFCFSLERIPVENELVPRSVSLFLDISCLGHPRSSYFNGTRAINQNRQLLMEALKKAIVRIGQSTLVFDLIQTVISHKINPSSCADLIWTAISIADSKEFLQELLDRFWMKNPNSKKVAFYLNQLEAELADCFYRFLCARQYSFSIVHFDALLANTSIPFDGLLQYSYEMEEHGVQANTDVIRLLLNRFITANDFKSIIVFAGNYGILPNEELMKALEERAIGDSQARDSILSFSIYQIEHLDITSQWKRFIVGAQIKLEQH